MTRPYKRYTIAGKRFEDVLRVERDHQIAELRAENAALKERIAELTAQLEAGKRQYPVFGDAFPFNGKGGGVMQEQVINGGAATAAPLSLRSINEIIADLSKPIAERHLKTRTQGGQKLTYISWDTAVRYLDHFAAGWSFEIRRVTAIGERCVVTARITIPCLEGTVWREATGTEDEELRGYGDPSSNAEAMALKRAGSKFGLGLYLYQK
jgi:hypothetical protein